ncbi:MAG TPA: GNAT family N-acetyltransferase [Gaiellaceae bacterium]|nr:GNAT family N-acetyltransferase [Gaiellaceae bacterium]
MIRRVESNDWESLRDVRLRSLASDPDAFLQTLEQAQTFPDEHWQERARPSDDQVTFVHENDGTFGGMVSAFVTDDEPEISYLVGMWVAPELRGSGVAPELVARVVAWSRERGLARVILSVEGSNLRAAGLYEKCGFAELAEQPPLPYEPNSGNRFYAFSL